MILRNILKRTFDTFYSTKKIRSDLNYNVVLDFEPKHHTTFLQAYQNRSSGSPCEFVFEKSYLRCSVICSPRIQAVYGFWYSDGALSAWELSCVEMGNIVCTRAYIQFDLIYVHFPHITNLKWIFSNVKINSKSIGGVVFPHTWTHLLLNEQFLTLTCKVVS